MPICAAVGSSLMSVCMMEGSEADVGLRAVIDVGEASESGIKESAG